MSFNTALAIGWDIYRLKRDYETLQDGRTPEQIPHAEKRQLWDYGEAAEAKREKLASLGYNLWATTARHTDADAWRSFLLQRQRPSEHDPAPSPSEPRPISYYNGVPATPSPVGEGEPETAPIGYIPPDPGDIPEWVPEPWDPPAPGAGFIEQLTYWLLEPFAHIARNVRDTVLVITGGISAAARGAFSVIVPWTPFVVGAILLFRYIGIKFKWGPIKV